MAEQRGIAMTILGIVAIIAIVGLVLLFTGGATGEVVNKGKSPQNVVLSGYQNLCAKLISNADNPGVSCYGKTFYDDRVDCECINHRTKTVVFTTTLYYT